MLCISAADLPRGSPWQSPLYRDRISELLPLGVTLPQLPAAWLNLFWFSVVLKKVIQEMDWTWSPVTCMEWEMDGKKSSWLYLVSYTEFFNYLTEFLPFHAEIVLSLLLLSLLAWHFCILSSIIWLLMMNCMSCQKHNLQLKQGLYLNFLLILAWLTLLL